MRLPPPPTPLLWCLRGGGLGRAAPPAFPTPHGMPPVPARRDTVYSERPGVDCSDSRHGAGRGNERYGTVHRAWIASYLPEVYCASHDSFNPTPPARRSRPSRLVDQRLDLVDRPRFPRTSPTRVPLCQAALSPCRAHGLRALTSGPPARPAAARVPANAGRQRHQHPARWAAVDAERRRNAAPQNSPPLLSTAATAAASPPAARPPRPGGHRPPCRRPRQGSAPCRAARPAVAAAPRSPLHRCCPDPHGRPLHGRKPAQRVHRRCPVGHRRRRGAGRRRRHPPPPASPLSKSIAAAARRAVPHTGGPPAPCGAPPPPSVVAAPPPHHPPPLLPLGGVV